MRPSHGSGLSGQCHIPAALLGDLTELARFLKSRADWYRALGYIRTSGADLFSHENRLPKNCVTGCPCDPCNQRYIVKLNQWF
jgi:hypothetical protein